MQAVKVIKNLNNYWRTEMIKESMDLVGDRGTTDIRESRNIPCLCLSIFFQKNKWVLIR